MFETYFIEFARFEHLLQKLSKRYNLFLPKIKEYPDKKADYVYQTYSDAAPFVFAPYRTIEPLKSFFTFPKEKVCSYFSPEEFNPGRNNILTGVKNCDIVGHKIQDFVFLEGVEIDQPYRLRRENTFFISGDCTDFKEVCHCLAWDIMPYSETGFDLNLSIMGEGYLVDVGSRKGEELLLEHKDFFSLARDTQISGRKVKREKLINRLRRHLLSQDLVSRKEVMEGLVKQGYQLDTWQKFMLTCVECGGCNLICDTCHCFLLSDVKEKNTNGSTSLAIGTERSRSANSKLRLWDACLYANYARVAGGANPLKTRAQRLRNRFMKKFDFFVDNLGMPACCGCGRCIEVCPGKIDIREVLKDLAKKIKAKG